MAGECDGVVGNGDEKCLCNEGDLGPKDLQHGSSPITLLEGYRRLGRLKPAEFLATWRTLVYLLFYGVLLLELIHSKFHIGC
jgi:hypothetical protein